ncbi:nucleotidyltransferase domain-containing protein [Shewanella acanthi]|uniref:nucleotidyltransferase domain-containing protein n=1 Tax=Shewanella acanthi TaxID=2864212 RepID=UPI001C6623A2|nr:nucleotidyltransferase domain-containing protein [Shewanella acanthi]QYJ80478.1 nucleotidyltransferase domain-containing protein [Shewanella acanthi]
MEIPGKIKDLVFQLANDSSIMEIWLIGSRASGNTHAASDWDLLVFSTSEPQATTSRVEGIDVLWKGPSGNVLLEGQPTSFQFEFSDFNWLAVDEGQATYRGRKLNEVPEGIRDASILLHSFIEGKAVCLWQRH